MWCTFGFVDSVGDVCAILFDWRLLENVLFGVEFDVVESANCVGVAVESAFQNVSIVSLAKRCCECLSP